MSRSDGDLKHRHANKNVGIEAQIMRLWRNKDTFRDWIHVLECYINGKETGCILPVSFSEAELKINELICLVE